MPLRATFLHFNSRHHARQSHYRALMALLQVRSTTPKEGWHGEVSVPQNFFGLMENDFPNPPASAETANTANAVSDIKKDQRRIHVPFAIQATHISFTARPTSFILIPSTMPGNLLQGTDGTVTGA